jgi:SprT-like family
MAVDADLSKQYQALFDELNCRYFNGRLPAYRIKVVDRLNWLNGRGEITRRTRLIRLQKRAAEADEMISTLLHEMAHAATNDHHAHKWREEMARLQRLGAPIAPIDLQTPPRVTRSFVRQVAEDALGDQPDAPLRGFIRWFIYEYGYAQSATAFRRKYPWAARVFSETRKRTRKEQEAMEALRERIHAEKEG